MSHLQPSILQAALQGLESQRERLDAQIAEIRSMLGGRRGATVAKRGPGGRKKRVISEDARRRMAEAQKRRWAAVREASGKGKKAAGKKATKKRGRRPAAAAEAMAAEQS